MKHINSNFTCKHRLATIVALLTLIATVFGVQMSASNAAIAEDDVVVYAVMSDSVANTWIAAPAGENPNESDYSGGYESLSGWLKGTDPYQSLYCESNSSKCSTPGLIPETMTCGKKPLRCWGSYTGQTGRVTYDLYQWKNSPIDTGSCYDFDTWPEDMSVVADCVNSIPGCVYVNGYERCSTELAFVRTVSIDFSTMSEQPESNQPDSATEPEAQVPSQSTKSPSSKQSFFSPSTVFTGLTLFEPPAEMLKRAALSGAVAVVLAILVSLPTQLINSTLSANDAMFRRWASKLRRNKTETHGETKDVVAIENPETTSVATSRNISKHHLGFTIKVLLVFICAAALASFADPEFGFNMMSLRIWLSLLLGFLIVNYAATVISWLVSKKSLLNRLPVIQIKYGFFALILISVLFSRLLQLEPAIVFGAVLAVVLAKQNGISEQQRENTQAQAENLVLARIEWVSALYAAVIGVLAWVGYNLITADTLTLDSGTSTVARELAAIVSIEALATLPLLLLPLTFLPGAKLWAWNKWVWFVSYSIALLLFSYILVPVDFSWSEVNTSFWSWISVFIAYSVFAVLFWAVFRIRHRTVVKSTSRRS